jgi:hypothetical protein
MVLRVGKVHLDHAFKFRDIHPGVRDSLPKFREAGRHFGML